MAVPEKVLAGLREVLAHYSGGSPEKGRTFSVRTSTSEDIKRLRGDRLKMTQKEFAVQFGIPIRTLQNWEQGERGPEGPARAYLSVIERIPEAVIEALRAERNDSVHET